MSNFERGDSVVLIKEGELIKGFIVSVETKQTNTIQQTKYEIQDEAAKSNYVVYHRTGESFESLSKKGYFGRVFLMSRFRFYTYITLAVVLVIALFAGV